MKRILIIEDDPITQELVKDILEEENYDVEVAGNGIDGLELQNSNPFDLIITDIVMPEKEGIETILEIKRDYPKVKLIAISGGASYGANGYLKMAKMLGVERTFPKPFERDDIVNAVKELLELKNE